MSEASRHTLILCLLLGLPVLAVGGPRLPRYGGARSNDAPALSRNVAEPAGQVAAPANPLAKSRPEVAQQPWFDAVRRQLQDLGAVYIRLERWEGICPVYQFRCDLELGSEETSRTSIEAFSGSAQVASEYVLLAARQWRYRVSDGNLQGPAATTLSGRQRPESY